MTRRKRYVVVTGSVAAGATTLAGVLGRYWHIDTLLEGAIQEINPFFERSQRDLERWGLTSQIHFLMSSVERHQRLRTMLIVQGGADVVVEDRTPFEHNGAYVRAFREKRWIPADELQLLAQVATFAETHYETPDLVVYREMTDEQLIARVHSRNRPGEEADEDRLRAVHAAFEAFIRDWDRSPIVAIPADLDLLDEAGAERAMQLVSAHWPAS